VPKVGVRLLAPTPTDDDAPTIVHPAFADPDADRRDFAQLTDTTWAETDNALADRLVAQVAWVAEGKGLASEPLSLYNDRDMVLAAIAPTAGLEAGRAWAPPGVWCVELSNEGSAAVEVHGWIRRNDTPFGSRAGGRQSWFEDVGYAVLRDDGRARVHDDPASDTPIRRTTTLNGIATGRNVVVVGAQREDDRSAAGYTAQGPTVPGSATEVVRRRGPSPPAAVHPPSSSPVPRDSRPGGRRTYNRRQCVPRASCWPPSNPATRRSATACSPRCPRSSARTSRPSTAGSTRAGAGAGCPASSR